jgi:hypothetical protein
MLHLIIQFIRLAGIVFFILMIAARATGFLVRYYQVFWMGTLLCFGISVLYWIVRMVWRRGGDGE